MKAFPCNSKVTGVKARSSTGVKANSSTGLLKRICNHNLVHPIGRVTFILAFFHQKSSKHFHFCSEVIVLSITSWDQSLRPTELETDNQSKRTDEQKHTDSQKMQRQGMLQKQVMDSHSQKERRAQLTRTDILKDPRTAQESREKETKENWSSVGHYISVTTATLTSALYSNCCQMFPSTRHQNSS